MSALDNCIKRLNTVIEGGCVSPIGPAHGAGFIEGMRAAVAIIQSEVLAELERSPIEQLIKDIAGDWPRPISIKTPPKKDDEYLTCEYGPPTEVSEWFICMFRDGKFWEKDCNGDPEYALDSIAFWLPLPLNPLITQDHRPGSLATDKSIEHASVCPSCGKPPTRTGDYTEQPDGRLKHFCNDCEISWPAGPPQKQANLPDPQWRVLGWRQQSVEGYDREPSEPLWFAWDSADNNFFDSNEDLMDSDYYEGPYHIYRRPHEMQVIEHPRNDSEGLAIIEAAKKAEKES